MTRRETTCFIALVSLLASFACPFVPGGRAYAQSPFAGGWTLQPAASKLNFQTIKSQTIVESSKFLTLRGTISPDGVATVTISLDSVDTGIDLRNVRLRFLFFEAFKFPEAIVTMRLNPGDVRDLVTARRITIPAAQYDLSLHGVTRQMTGDIVVTMLSETMVSVASSAPISVAATDFGLSDGVKKLEDANQVPIIPSGSVTFDFLFQKNDGGTPKANPATVPPPQTAIEKAGELDPEACAGRFDIISTTGAIYFRNGSAELEAESRPLLDSIVQIIQRCPRLIIEVAGHTDAMGNAPANRLLSEARASAVAHYLTTHGIAKDRLEAVGFGDSRPVAPNDTAANRSLNRRIVFSVKSAG